MAVWADKPFPLIPTPCGPHSSAKEHGSRMIAQEMTHLHNCILRVLNAIYNQAPYVKTPNDIRAFLQLVKLWHDELEHHHKIEEEAFFPGIERCTGEKNIMEGNVEQHHEFEPGLAAMLKFAVETSVEDYDAGKLRAVIDGFGDILQTHLTEEIDTLLALQKYDSDALKACWAETHKYVLKTCNQVQSPFSKPLLTHLSNTISRKSNCPCS
jgi:hemerythrin-like domain-containing protein